MQRRRSSVKCLCLLLATALCACVLSAGCRPTKTESATAKDGRKVESKAESTARGLPDLAAYGPMVMHHTIKPTREEMGRGGPPPLRPPVPPDRARAEHGLLLRAKAIPGVLNGQRSLAVAITLVNVSDKPISVLRYLTEADILFRYADDDQPIWLPSGGSMEFDQTDTALLEPSHSLSLTTCYTGFLDAFAQPGKTIEFQVAFSPFAFAWDRGPDGTLTTPWTPIELPPEAEGR